MTDGAGGAGKAFICLLTTWVADDEVCTGWPADSLTADTCSDIEVFIKARDIQLGLCILNFSSSASLAYNIAVSVYKPSFLSLHPANVS